jgi:DNA repair photolyase
MEQKPESYIKGRGAQLNTHNRFLENKLVFEHIEGLDEPFELQAQTQIFEENPKKILNKVDSPDIGLAYSMNPYQGCEHGCIYCYARNTHEYWGFSAGFDFESKIIVKRNAPEVLEKTLQNPKWKPEPIMFSGNTDCYQPIERKLLITRKMLEVLLKFKHPASMITKNALILRDIDILKEMASQNLVHVSVSITSLDEDLRQLLEPRTATSKRRLQIVKTLSENGIPVNVMVAPIIPSVNSSEVPAIIKAASENGAVSAGYTIVRLNGAIGQIFTDWVHKNFPDRAEKVLHQIAECHGGTLNDSRWGTRMRGEGKIAESIRNLFYVAKEKHLKNKSLPSLDFSLFKRPEKGQLSLF